MFSFNTTLFSDRNTASHTHSRPCSRVPYTLTMSKQTQMEWRVAEATGFDGLKLNESAPIPEIGDKEVLVKCQ